MTLALSRCHDLTCAPNRQLVRRTQTLLIAKPSSGGPLSKQGAYAVDPVLARAQRSWRRWTQQRPSGSVDPIGHSSGQRRTTLVPRYGCQTPVEGDSNVRIRWSRSKPKKTAEAGARPTRTLFAWLTPRSAPRGRALVIGGARSLSFVRADGRCGSDSGFCYAS